MLAVSNSPNPREAVHICPSRQRIRLRSSRWEASPGPAAQEFRVEGQLRGLGFRGFRALGFGAALGFGVWGMNFRWMCHRSGFTCCARFVPWLYVHDVSDVRLNEAQDDDMHNTLQHPADTTYEGDRHCQQKTANLSFRILSPASRNFGFPTVPSQHLDTKSLN